MGSQYLDGKYTCSNVPTLLEVFAAYAPASDGNDPEAYARLVFRDLAVSADTTANRLIHT